MTKWRAVSWLLRVAVKYFVRWLIREMLVELREGLFLRVVLHGRVYWLEVKLVEGVMRASEKAVVDIG